MKIRHLLSLILTLTVSFHSFSQKPENYTSSDIEQMLNKLEVLGSVLYIAAHPDDENTRVISYLANEKLFETAYLSATRGDGGQNLIGPEIREGLGVIRTQELLAARRTDGGKQYFSRANDFGYSKNPEETFEIWEREKVLEDFVLAIRRHRPDVIITRFPEDGRGGHGHHTASAILAREAMDLAPDRKAFPESAEEYGTWQVKRLFFNTHYWFHSRHGIKMDTAQFYTLDVGSYNPLLGQSYPEIAAQSRSMHKSQGFGTTGTRGELIEYFEHVHGDKPNGKPNDADIFQGVDPSWDRVKGGKKIQSLIEEISVQYNSKKPSEIIPQLVTLRKEIAQIKDSFWKEKKLGEVDELILACTGLYAEIIANDYSYSPGDSLSYTVEIINRSTEKLRLENLKIHNLNPTEVNKTLHFNQPYKTTGTLTIPQDQPYSSPYWLTEPATLGMYTVTNKNLIGRPENPSVFKASVTLEVSGESLEVTVPIVFKKNDPVDGEVYRPIEIVPPVMVSISDGVYVFGNETPKTVEVSVTAGKKEVEGQVTLIAASGWKIEPSEYTYHIQQKGGQESFKFTVYPPKKQSKIELKAQTVYQGKTYHQSLIRIEYDHIPPQIMLPTASAQLVKVQLEKKGQNIAYIQGAGDQIPISLKQIGYQVTELADEDIRKEKLSTYDAVILGIRAFNTRDVLKYRNEELFQYVKEGGTVIVQYNTSHRLLTPDIAPYPLSLSRDRITKEEAKISILEPKHEIMTSPNQITAEDFEGWVQERGLYFPNEWSKEFTPILSGHDPKEPDRKGGLLVAKYGKGYYIYTGYSWFRELPAGVPGAYRLFTNMISIGQK